VTGREDAMSVSDWADETAGGSGEEGEHTLDFDPDDPDKLGCIQVWHDTADDDDRPLVGFFGSVYSDSHEFRWDLSPDQALELAAMLIVHAESARAAALERALDL
jgi:hypothetical protein